VLPDLNQATGFAFAQRQLCEHWRTIALAGVPALVRWVRTGSWVERRTAERRKIPPTRVVLPVSQLGFPRFIQYNEHNEVAIPDRRVAQRRAA
jgi:hypothetical protein